MLLRRYPTRAENARNRDNRRHSDTTRDKDTGGSHESHTALKRRSYGIRGQTWTKYKLYKKKDQQEQVGIYFQA